MLSKVFGWLSGATKYIIAALSFVIVFLFALLKAKEASHAKQEADRAKDQAKTQGRIAKAYADGEQAFRDKTNRPVDRGYFTNRGGPNRS
jgi:uncharacterized membrane protein